MQHIAFDIGNVLCRVDLNPFYKEMSRCGFSKPLTDLFLDHGSNLDFCNIVPFKLSLKKIIYDNCAYEIDSYEFTQIVNNLFSAWNKCVSLDETMYGFVSNLYEDGFKIALLSNIGSAHAEKLEGDYPDLMKKIYYKHYSYQCGMAKPSKLFFQSFLLQNDDFAGCTYLDDKVENIKVACSCRFSGILFDIDKFKTKVELKKELTKISTRLGKG